MAKKSKLPPKVTEDKVYPIRVQMDEYLNGTKPGDCTTVRKCHHYAYIFPEDLKDG